MHTSNGRRSRTTLTSSPVWGDVYARAIIKNRSEQAIAGSGGASPALRRTPSSLGDGEVGNLVNKACLSSAGLTMLATKERMSDVIECCDIAREMRLPLDQIKHAYSLFREFAEPPPPGKGFIDGSRLGRGQFSKLVRKLKVSTSSTPTESEDEDGDPAARPRRSRSLRRGSFSPQQTITDAAFQFADKDGSDDIDFREFIIWMSSRSFDEELTLNLAEQTLRSMAKKYSMTLFDVEQYKTYFDEVDVDANGWIDTQEFQGLLYKCGRVPPEIGLPHRRIQQLWMEADLDSNGVIDFEEFLIFYRKHFNRGTASSGISGKSDGACAFRSFYQNVRRHTMTATGYRSTTSMR